MFQFYLVYNFEKFISFGLGTVRSERVNFIQYFCLSGCFCVFASLESLSFVRDYLDELNVKSKYDSIEDSNPIQLPPPTFLVLARNPNNDDIHELRKEGQELASR